MTKNKSDRKWSYERKSHYLKKECKFLDFLCTCMKTFIQKFHSRRCYPDNFSRNNYMELNLTCDVTGERIKSCQIQKVNPDEITRRGHGDKLHLFVKSVGYQDSYQGADNSSL